jgi:hypothetical protein
MLLSLWPVGAVAASIASTPSTTVSTPAQSQTDYASAPSTTVSTPQSQTDYATLKQLSQREDLLLSRLHASSVRQGVADQGVAQDALRLGSDYSLWINLNSSADPRTKNIAEQQANVANRAAAFAAQPSQALVDLFNSAIAAYNAAISAQ